MVDRKFLSDLIYNACTSKKVTLLFGARQVGKSTLLKQFLNEQEKKKKTYKLINADNYYDRAYFNNTDKIALINELSQYDYLAIDEAQKLEEMDLFIKNFADYVKTESRLILTGSSSIEIKNQIKESNAGRKREIEIYPPAIFEIYKDEKTAKTNLEDRLIFGSYPEISLSDKPLHRDEKIDLLRSIVNDYLFKDIFTLDGLKNASKIEHLAMLVAYRAGQILNLNDLANELQLNRATVEKYLELMEKSFLVFKLDSFSKEAATSLKKQNPSNAIKKQKKYYFYDNGIRNALINDFSGLAFRSDIGALWENFIIAEKRKLNKYIHGNSLKTYFWRVKANLGDQEIDLIEELGDGKLNHLYAYELKYSKEETKIKIPSQWEKDFPLANFNVINRSNFYEFLENV